MAFRYVAKLFFDDREIAHENGNDIDELYTWMLIKTQNQFGNFNGEILDKETGKVVKSFRKSPPD